MAKPDWKSLETEAEEITRRPRTECSVKLLLDFLSPMAEEAVLAALARKELTHTSIAAALRKRVGDRAPKAGAIGRHRKGECHCERR